ncbi:MAG TPA: hypothetical protein VEZ55_06165 [Chitinophagaceae bacterium]|nr:hypothetical protein [Chitinophagaceae bacterium]
MKRDFRYLKVLSSYLEPLEAPFLAAAFFGAAFLAAAFFGAAFLAAAFFGAAFFAVAMFFLNLMVSKKK